MLRRRDGKATASTSLSSFPLKWLSWDSAEDASRDWLVGVTPPPPPTTPLAWAPNNTQSVLGELNSAVAPIFSCIIGGIGVYLRISSCRDDHQYCF